VTALAPPDTNFSHEGCEKADRHEQRTPDGSRVFAQRSHIPRLDRAVKTEVDQTDRTDEALAAEAAREGSDGPAFAELVRRQRDPVWRICFRLMGNEHDAADAAQEVFVRLFFNRDKFAGRSKYATWAHSVAVRTCLAMRRARGRRQKRVGSATDELIETSPSHDSPDAAANHLDLTQMLDVLDEDDRALLLLKYAENYSHEDLAEMFDISVSACKMRISRAREKVKEKFGE
jgi:RNA polymerase sigma-70 factor (ECF subfamily)